MKLHHQKHHQTYVNQYNLAIEKLEAAQSKGDKEAAAALDPVINFHGGGHLNHSLFWENLISSREGGGGSPTGSLKVRRTLSVSMFCFPHSVTILFIFFLYNRCAASGKMRPTHERSHLS